jgi:hypothetical protein
VNAPDIRGTARLIAHVASRAERLVACPAQYNDTYFRIVSSPVHGVRKLVVRQGAHGVTLLRAVYGDASGSARRFKKDVLVFQFATSHA